MLAAKFLGERLRARAPVWLQTPALGAKLTGRTLAIDWALACACLLVIAPPLWRQWNLLIPHHGLSGSDAVNNLGCALAFELNNFDLYYLDRYPGYPWVVSLWAHGGREVPRALAEVSMAVTVLAAIPLYWVGRLLSGRVAGVVGAVLALRQVLAVEVGRSATPYPMEGFLVATMLAAGLALVRGARTTPALVFTLAGALAIGTDAKLVPPVLASGLVLAVWCTFASGRPLWARAVVFLAVLAPLPVAHFSLLPYHLDLVPLEEMLRRMPGAIAGPTVAAHTTDGFRIGSPTGVWQLGRSLYRLATDVGSETGHHLCPSFGPGLALVFPQTAPLWGWLLALCPLVLLIRGGRGRLPACALLFIVATSGLPLARWYYQHRYAMPTALLVPPVIASALPPAAAIAVGAVAFLHPDSPVGHVDTTYLSRKTTKTDSWALKEDEHGMRAASWAAENLTEGTRIYDWSATDPAPILGSVVPYAACQLRGNRCAAQMLADTGTVVAVMRARDTLTAEIPGGDGQELSEPVPTGVGECWRRIYMIRPDAGIYQWMCDHARMTATAPHRTIGPPQP